MIRLINTLKWLALEMSPDDLQSIREISVTLDKQNPLISEPYLKLLVDDIS